MKRNMCKRFIRILIALTLIVTLHGCATVKKTSVPLARGDKAYIYIKRPSFGGAAWVHYMDLNNIYIGQVKGGDCIRIEVDPGTYILNYYNGSMMTYEKAKSFGASFQKTFNLKAGDSKFIAIEIHAVDISCHDEDGSKGYDKINNTIDFSVLQEMSPKVEDVPIVQQTQLPKDEPDNMVAGLGETALEQTVIHWDIQSRPQGADIFWRVTSKTPEVKSTNNKYLMTTPYEATKTLDIRGLTYQTSGNVQIILRCEKDGYLPQEKEYNVRMILDQEEISAFFRLVQED